MYEFSVKYMIDRMICDALLKRYKIEPKFLLVNKNGFMNRKRKISRDGETSQALVKKSGLLSVKMVMLYVVVILEGNRPP